MAYNFLTKDNVFTRFEMSKTYTDSLTTPFPEYQRIADNKPKEGMPDHLPKNTDGTTSSIVKKTPRRTIQQLPSGSCTCDSDWLGIVGSYILFNEIVPNANSINELIEKCWQSTTGSLIRGFAGVYCPYIKNGDYEGPDYIVPWWGDIYVQPGKMSDTDSKYMFLRTWWREEDIEALIDRVGKMDKDDAVESGWDVEVLKKIKDKEQTKDDKALNTTDRMQAINQRGGIELIIGFQEGVDAEFITFHRSSHLVARTKKNKDPRGKMPLMFQYCETDGTNPFGRGFVEMVAPLQNLIDADDQMYQFNRALMLAPPIIKRGNWNKSQAQMVPNSIWDLGSNPANTAEALTVDSSALVNYPALYQLNQSRLFQLLSAPTTQIAAGVGTVGSSKTPDGVKQTNATLSIDDNFIRKKFEAVFENWGETSINLWFAEHVGTEELQLDDDTVAKLRNLEEFDDSLISEDKKIRINYDDDTEVISFKVDASTSQKNDDQQQVQTLTTLLATLENTPVLQGVVPQEKLIAAWNSIVAASGVEDPEDLRVSDEEFQQHMEKMAQQAQAAQEAAQPAPEQPKPISESIDYDSIYKDPSTPPEVKAQILEKVGLQVDPESFDNMVATDQTQHMVNQAENLAKTAGAINPEQDPAEMAQDGGQPEMVNEGDEPQPMQPESEEPMQNESLEQDIDGDGDFDEQDIAIIQQLQQAGISDEQIGRGMAMIASGMPPEDVMQELMGAVA